MRIALSALQQRHYLTGTGRYIAELFCELPGLAPQHEFILYVKPDQVPLFPVAHKNARLAVMKSCPSSPARRTAWELLRFPGQLKKDRIDLYHGPANFLPLRKVCPYVLTMHDMVYFHNPDRTTRMRAAYWQWYLRRQWPLADAILTDSEFSKNEIAKYLPVPPERIDVIYIGVEERFFAKPDAERRRAMREEIDVAAPYVLYVGRLDPDKNLERVLRAFAAVAPDHPGLMLVLAGAKDYRATELPALANSLRISERVRFAGYVSEPNLVALYHEAIAFCYPSLNEGFGLPVAEAMAAGVPTVTSNISSLPEVAGDGAIQVDPFDEAAIAEGLRIALSEGGRAQYTVVGPERARRFSWRTAAQLTLEAYERAMTVKR